MALNFPSNPQVDDVWTDGNGEKWKFNGEMWRRQISVINGGGGETDHGALTGLLDDDHTQYHNDARGDARYSLLSHNHDGAYDALGAAAAVQSNLDTHEADTNNPHSVTYAQLPDKPTIPDPQTYLHADLTDVSEDQHHAKSHTHDGLDGSGLVSYDSLTDKPTIPDPQTYLHADLTDVSEDQHHPKSHAHNGVDGSGLVSYDSLTDKPTIPEPQTYLHADLTDVSADQHHAKSHTHDGLDGSGVVDYSDLGNIPASFPPSAHTHPLSEITDNGTMAYEDDALSDGKQYARQDGAWAEVVGGGGGATTFLELTDTPADYAGNAGKLVKVDPTGAFLIFGDPSGATVSWGDIQGTLSDQTDLQNALDGKSDTTHNHDGSYDALGAAAAVQANLDTHEADVANPHSVTYAQLPDKPTIPPAQTYLHADLTDVGPDQHHAQSHAHNGVDGSGLVSYNSLTDKPTIPPAQTYLHDDLTDVGPDQHHPQSHAHDGLDGSGTVSYNSLTDKPTIPPAQTYLHDDLTDVGPDQHHAQSHAHNGADGSGTVSYNSLTDKPTIPPEQTYLHADLTDVGPDQHHPQSHAHDGLDGSGTVDYGDLTGVPATFPPSAHTHLLADITDSGEMAAVDDAPNDGKQYARQSLTWAEVAGGGGIEEAPIDGSPYSRQDAGWVLSPTGGGGGSLTVSDTPPSNPSNGDQWMDSKLGLVSTWYQDADSGQWVSDPLDATEATVAYITSVNGDTGPDVVLDNTDVGAAPTVHTHAISDVTGLQTALDGKSATDHNHDGVYEPANANIQNHIGITSGNPHGITTDTIGAAATNTANLTLEVVASLPGTPDADTLYIVTG